MQKFIASGGLPEFYRCEIVDRTQQEWSAEGKKNYVYGIYCLLYGAIFQMLCVPCMIVLRQTDLWVLPVYKIMFFIIVFDIMNLTSNGVLQGYFLLRGIVYCSYPIPIYIWGCVSTASWFGGCIGCFFLVLTRLIDLMSPKMHDKLFSGKRILCVFVIMCGYVIFGFLFAMPALFNSTVNSWIYDPLIFHDGRNSAHYSNTWNLINNLGIVTSTLVMSITFFVLFIYKVNLSYGFSMNKKQKQILVQTFVICSINLAAAGIYVSFTFVNAGPVLIYAGFIFWQLSSASGVLVFYIMNKTTRTRIFSLLKLQSSAKISTRSSGGAVVI